MIIIAVVVGLDEFYELKMNSFLTALELGYATVVVKPSHLTLVDFEFERQIEIIDFSDFVEENVAQALKSLEKDVFVLHVDPDEFYSKELLSDILLFSESMEVNDVGLIKMQYFFKNRALCGTPWGGIGHFARVAMPTKFRNRINVHERLVGREVLVQTNQIVKHFWADSYEQIIRKHDRYLASEGVAKIAQFGNFVLKDSLVRIIRAHLGILKRVNFRDGFTGIRLALIFSAYVINAELEFRKTSRIANSMT
jgi:hypothetical protein